MDKQSNHFVVFIVEDDDDDILLLKNELIANGVDLEVHFFSDIHGLIDFFNDREHNILPALILLNTFMRPYDIQQAVTLIKGVSGLQTVPLVVMLGSQGDREYLRSYNLDVSGYVLKPVNGQILKQFLRIK